MNHTKPLVSIVMTLRDAERYLDPCLDSISQQSYEDWELLVVDDHSTDRTAEMMSLWADRDPRIRPVQVQGRGIIHGLRSGYAMARGDFITRMDGDDKMSHDKLETLLSMLQHKGRGHVAVGSVAYFSEETLGDGYKSYAAWLNQLTRTSSNFDEIYKECVIPSPCWMMHQEDFDVCGGFERDRYPEDYDLVFRMKKYGMKVIGTEKILHHWRDHAYRTSRHDPHYSDNTFLDIKVHYFIEDDRVRSMPLVLWGAGKKGKALATRLNETKESYEWITSNENKIGKEIYGIRLLPQESLREMPPSQVIIMISSPDDRAEVAHIISTLPQHRFYPWM